MPVWFHSTYREWYNYGVQLLEKTAASKDRMRVAQTRIGRRPMHVETMLRKEKDGNLFKTAYPQMLAFLDEFLKIASTENSPVGLLVNEQGPYDPAVIEKAKPAQQFPSRPTLPLHEQPVPPEDTPPPGMADAGLSMTKLQYARHAMADELCKVAQGVSGVEATDALKRLQKLEEAKPTGGELARNAMAGAMVGPAMTTVSGLIAGRQPFQEALESYRNLAARGGAVVPKGLRASLGDPTFRKEVIRRGTVRTGRGMLAAGASGAILGGLMPVIRTKLHEGAEKEKLRQYLGTSTRGQLRGKVKAQLGVG